MHIHYIQHVSFEGLGSIEEWIALKGHSYSCTQVYLNERFPNVDSIDGLIVMGGPMSSYDEDTIGWLKVEKEFINQVIHANKPVLGICLGSQLIADVLGANVFVSTHKEIGWFDVILSDNAIQHPLFNHFPKRFKTFHWHGDTFSLPAQSLHIAFSDATLNQAYVFNDKVVGFQFHPEVTKDTVSNLSEMEERELIKAPFIQCKEDILAGIENIERNKTVMFEFLDKFFRF